MLTVLPSIGSGCRHALAFSDLHSQTPALLFFFFILFIKFFKLNLSTFYTSSQVVKTRKNKLNYEVACNRYLHSLLPETSLAIHTNRACCQWRQDAVVVKRLKLI